MCIYRCIYIYIGECSSGSEFRRGHTFHQLIWPFEISDPLKGETGRYLPFLIFSNDTVATTYL